MKFRLPLAAIAMVLTACAAPTGQAPSTPVPTASIAPQGLLTDEQAATLDSLELVDDYPLYTMRYSAPYGAQAQIDDGRESAGMLAPSAIDGQASCPVPIGALGRTFDGEAWGCSLFAALGNAASRLYGRNFDWQFSPALLLFTDPPDGYASVSMVAMEYLGFEGEDSRHITELPLEERISLLDAPFLPFDGMNEKGLAIGMAAVPREEMPHDPQKATLDHLEVIREMLDHAETVEEAVEILDGHNINMGNVPLHYLIASTSGESALVEFYAGEMFVFRNESAWQTATNFLVASTDGQPEGQCPRYDRMSDRLEELEGAVSDQEAFRLLEDVSQDNTQWSVVYGMTGGEVRIVMGREYSGRVHTFQLE